MKDWSPELAAFAAKSYHGHRGVPATMDVFIDKLKEWNKSAAVKQVQSILDKDKMIENEDRDRVNLDLSNIDPKSLIGLYIKKEFDGFGLCDGLIKSVDKEVGSDRDLFIIEYTDGDVENLFFNELIKYLRVDVVYNHINK